MSISELMHRPERARRLEVFTGAGRRRNWPADEKAAIVARLEQCLRVWMSCTFVFVELFGHDRDAARRM